MLGADLRNIAPMGVKKIAHWLNDNGYRTRGNAYWGIGPIHRLLKDKIYKGEYWRKTSNGNRHPILIQVPSLISVEAFDEVQRVLMARSPKSTPPRTVSTPTLLVGLAFCPSCGGGMLLSTGKGGKYRYYVCGTRFRKGAGTCEGRRVRMDQTDELVISAVVQSCLTLERLSKMLRELSKRCAANDAQRAKRLSGQQKRLSEINESIARLLSLVEKGLMDVSDPILAERLANLRGEHQLATAEVDAALTKLAQTAEVSTEHVTAFATLMKEQLTNGSASLQQSYLRSVLDRVEIDDAEVRIYAREGDPKLSAFQLRSRSKSDITRRKPLRIVSKPDITTSVN